MGDSDARRSRGARGAPADRAFASLHDSPAERELVGVLLRWPDLLEATDAAGLSADHLGNVAARATYRAIAALHADAHPVSLVSVARWLGEHNSPVGPADAAALVDGVVKYSPSDVQAAAARLVRLADARDLAGACDTTLRRLADDGLHGFAPALAGLRRHVEAGPADAGLPWLSETDLAALPVPPALVEGRVWLPARGLAVIFGPPAEGKSFAALALALSVTTGEPWLGARVAAPGPAVYLAGEGAAGLGVRVAAWRAAHPAARQGAGLGVLPHTLDLGDPAARAALVADLKQRQPRLIVVDTLARYLVGDENLQSDMGRFIDGCAQLADAAAALVLVVHHVGATGQRERGSTALRGAADLMTEVQVRDDARWLVCSKAKDIEPWRDRRFDLAPVAGSLVALPPGAAAPAPGLSPHQRTALAALVDAFGTRGATSSEWQEATGPSVPRSSFYRVRQKLLDAGLVTEAKGRFRPASDVFTGDTDDE